VLAGVKYDMDFAENIEANQYVTWLILVPETACYER
jgi:hypothetical protein